MDAMVPSGSVTPAIRRGEVEPFRAMAIVERAGRLRESGRDIVMLCVGQPSAPAPTGARQAAAHALAAGAIGYTEAAGRPSLRRRIARYYGERHGVTVDPASVMVTTGSSAGFALAFLSAFEPGARVAIPSPGYPAYRNILRALALEPVEVAAEDADRWVLTPEALERAHAEHTLSGLLVANPNNPNGTMMAPEAFRALLDAARAMGLTVISDEIYHGLSFGPPEVTAAALDPDAFVINSISKYWCMTGWRIGWMLVPQAHRERVERLQQNAFICAPDLSQIAAEAALDGGAEMDLVRETYRANRAMVLATCPSLGIARVQPIDSAFYAYGDVSPLTDDSEALAARLLEEVGVAVTPGVDFDTARGRHWLRLSLCGDPQRLAEGLERMAAFIARG